MSATVEQNAKYRDGITSITTFDLVLDITLVTTAWWARHAPKTMDLASVLQLY